MNRSFGPFTLDPVSATLRRDGAAISLGHRAFTLLQKLLDADGQPVSKSDLLEAAWPDQIVEEGNLTVQMSALRKAIGDALIVTVPRVGYRLLSPPASASSSSESVLPSLAVLPFQNLSGDSEQDYFADGVVDDIITALSRFKSFAVIARNSSFIYRGRSVDIRRVAQDLDVRYVLQGSVRRASDRFRISAQLVDSTTGKNLWVEQFDGTIDDVFDFQDRITRRVAVEVEPHILAAEIARARLERPGSIVAYDIYLKTLAIDANRAVNENAEAYALVTEALDAEPENALLLAHAAWVLDHRCAMGWPPFGPDDVKECTELAHRGLQFAAGNPTVKAKCGIALLQTAKEYDLAMAVLRSAVEANPNNLPVTIQAGIGELHCGSVGDALAHFHRALRLSPRDPFAFVALTGIAHAQIVLGDYQTSLDWANRSLALNPTFDPTLWMLTAANAHLGRTAEAAHNLEAFRKIAPNATIASIRAGQPQKYTDRVATILEGLRVAGLPEA